MATYELMDIGEINRTEGLKGKKVEVVGTTSGIVLKRSILCRDAYCGFLTNGSSYLFIYKDIDSSIDGYREISIMKTSSERDEPLVVQGTIKGKKPPYKLKIKAFMMQKYMLEGSFYGEMEG